MKKKILFITPSLCQGGIEHSLITMLNLLDKTKYEITLFIYIKDLSLLPLVPEEVKVIIDDDHNHYFRRPKALFNNLLKNTFRLLKNQKEYDKYTERLRKYIHEQKVKHPAKDYFEKEYYDIVVSYAIGICTEMALYITANNKIVFYHASVDMHHDLLCDIFPKYNRIVAVSDGVKAMLCENYPHVADKIFVLENYVDSQLIINKSNEPLPNNVTIDNKKLNLCTCGRFSEEKGFDMAVECAKRLKSKNLNFVWYFVGDGSEREKVDSLIEKYDLAENILITGYTDNPFPYIKACDIYVQPSYHESYGRTIKEAQILNKPIVSTDTVGGKTILKNGELGVLTSIDAASLSEGIISLSDRIKDGFSFNAYTDEDNKAEKQKFVGLLESLL